MPSLSTVVALTAVNAGARGNRMYNPCGSGYGPSTLIVQMPFSDQTTQNVTFMVCSSTAGTPEVDLGLALGLGLGLGLPFVAFVLYLIFTTRRPCQRLPPPVGEDGIRGRAIAPLNERAHIQEEDPNKIVFDKLGHHLHRQFLAGNITPELKVMMKSFSVADLNMLEMFAFKIGKTELAHYINDEILNKNIPLFVNVTVPN